MLEDEQNDAVANDAAENDATKNDAEALANLQKALEEEKAKADSHWQRLLRLQADFENANRRAAKDLENAHKYGVEKIILELLPVVDSLERSLESKQEAQDSIFEGVKLTLDLMHSALERFHVKVVNPEAQKFDPALHEAIGMQEVADISPGMVVTVVQKGYCLHERVLRPARVVVSKAQAAQKLDEEA